MDAASLSRYCRISTWCIKLCRYLYQAYVGEHMQALVLIADSAGYKFFSHDWCCFSVLNEILIFQDFVSTYGASRTVSGNLYYLKLSSRLSNFLFKLYGAAGTTVTVPHSFS